MGLMILAVIPIVYIIAIVISVMILMGKTNAKITDMEFEVWRFIKIHVRNKR